MRRSVYIKTFGCQMNVVDSARMLSLLSKADYDVAPSLEDADLVLLNTCSVREKADQKIYSELGVLRRWKTLRDGRLVGVGGCLAQQAGEALRSRAPHVDIVFGTHNISKLPEMVRLAERRFSPLSSISALQIQPIVINNTTKEGIGSLAEIPFIFNTEGAYQNLTALLQDLRTSSRLVSIDSVSMSKTVDGTSIIMSLSGKAYYLK